jgi:hypothetical protein
MNYNGIFQVLETISCINVGKGCVHKIQSGRTLIQTLRKQQLLLQLCLLLLSIVIKCNEDCISLFYLSHFLLWYIELLTPTDITIMCLYKVFSRLGCTCNTGIQCFMNFCLQHWQMKESYCCQLVGPGVDCT